MANIIKADNGASSGVTGIVQTADSSGQLALQTTTSGGTATTALTIDNSQKVTFANPPTATGGSSVSTNTAYGTNALLVNTTGSSTSAFGGNALQANTTGTDNTAVGRNSMYSNTTGSENTSVGKEALFSNTTASNNTAVGYQAGYTNSTGAGLTAFGYKALYTSDANGTNAAFGDRSLTACSTGYYNTSIGNASLIATTSGFGNTALGYLAGSNLTTGSYNTYIGINCVASSVSVSSEIIIGGSGSTGKGSNNGFFNPTGAGSNYQGNNSTLWAITSDERLKKNIVDNTVGLSAINQIKVRNFEYRLPEEITDLDKSNAVDVVGVQLGPIAQELQPILPDCVKIESTGVMSVDASDVMWHIVNAIKELNDLVTAQATEIAALKAKVGA